MKTSLLGSCAKSNLQLPNSLARAFLIFRKLAWLQQQQKVVCHSKKSLLSTSYFDHVLPVNIEPNTSFFGVRNTFTGIIWKQEDKTNVFAVLHAMMSRYQIR